MTNRWTRLLADWKLLFSKKYFKEDLIAGLTVACIAIPLSLAIALASGVKPEIGLVTAVVGGIVGALFGGTPLAVSGPAAAMAVLIASIVQTHGLGGLLIIGLGSGLLQLLFGFLGWGRVARLVPMPVIAGFTAGIGAVIFIGQLPRALGLPAPPEAETLSVITHLADYVHATKAESLLLAAVTLAIIYGLPRLIPRVPATLVAVLAAALMAHFLNLNADLIGAIPNSLPLPTLPSLPQSGYGALMLATFMVFALASLETLLSSTAIDKLTKNSRHDSNQELIGQGLSNVASSLFGGIPVTGVIARSALNVQTGARTRRAALLHAVVLILVIYFAAEWIAKIPIAALAGVLLSVSLRMMNWQEFKEVLKVSRSETLVYLFTFITILAVDLLVGIQVGVAVAIVIAAIRAAKTYVEVHSVEGSGAVRIHINGSLSFLTSSSFDKIRKGIDKAKQSGCRHFVIDMSEVWRVDATGAEELISLVRETATDGSQIALQGLRSAARTTLERADHDSVLNGRIVVSEAELQKVFGNDSLGATERLIYGVKRFRRNKEYRYGELLNQLADGQTPHTLFVTCADSRLNPNFLTSTDLGELFVVRNVGNAITPASSGGITSERGALEFAVNVLGIREIVICGHTGCGAMKAICSHAPLNDTPFFRHYLQSPAFHGVQAAAGGDADYASRLNVIQQREHLLSYPFIKKLVEAGELRIHLWVYDLKRADVDMYNGQTKTFEPISDRYASWPQTVPEAKAPLRVFSDERSRPLDDIL